ncbi:MAG: hypothetical protein ABIE92_06565, partial [bacterium]
MKQSYSIIILSISLVLTFMVLNAADKPQVLYVMKDSENLRKAPNGEKIGEIFQATEMNVIEEKGEWVKVQIVGWVWSASTTSDTNLAKKDKEHSEETETKIAGGFLYRNVSFKSTFGGYTNIMGEMINNSGRDYTLANFVVSVYDKNKRLIGTGYINISNFL